MKQVPFHPNRADNKSCALACLKSITEYFGKKYSWSELETITGFKPGKVAWTVKTWTYLAKQGFDIKMIEAFDYRAYERQGEAYLQTFLKPEELNWQLKNSNILEIRPLLPEFFKTVRHVQKSPTLADINDMLDDGYLVTVQLNSKVLNKKPGYSAHLILVYDKVEGEYIAHDPGRPSFESRRIDGRLLYKAMGGTDNTVEVTGVKLKDHE